MRNETKIGCPKNKSIKKWKFQVRNIRRIPVSWKTERKMFTQKGSLKAIFITNNKDMQEIKTITGLNLKSKLNEGIK